MKILDQGEIKYCPEVKEMKRWYETDSLYFRFAFSDDKTTWKFVKDDELNESKIEVENEYYREPSRKFIKWKNKCFKESHHTGGMIPNDDYRFSKNPYKECVTEFWGRQEILDYMNIIPFTPSVMINISPNWNGKFQPNKIGKLKKLINSYMSEGWYDRWEYVIENGSEGKHIHAHIVAHMNVQRLKSVESHLRKGNHTRQLQKWSKKIEGMEGLIEGVSVQKIILRTEELVNDKLDYLIEDKKPQGHKNKFVIEDGFVKGEL